MGYVGLESGRSESSDSEAAAKEDMAVVVDLGGSGWEQRGA